MSCLKLTLCNLTSFLLEPICPSLKESHIKIWTLDSKSNFYEDVSSILSKLIAVIWKLQTVLRRDSIATINKAFIRPHLDYIDVIYDKMFNECWDINPELAQYHAALNVKDATWRTNTVKLYSDVLSEIHLVQLNIVSTKKSVRA